MKRHIWGVIVTTVIAPYLVAFLWCLFGLVLGGVYGVREASDILKTIVIGTFGLLLFGIPLLIFTSICAIVMNAVGSHSRRIMVISGAVLGLGFTIALLGRSLDYDKETMIMLNAGLLSGAICGWIYWRIALRGQAASARAIDAA